MHPDRAADPRFDLAHAVIRAAGELAARYFADLTQLRLETKVGAQDVVSQADREVEALIRTRLLQAFPEDGFLGEEQGLHPGRNGYLWVVDPIDGTSLFVAGLNDWCISIALMRDGVPELGLVLQPTSAELFTAKAGQGAYLNGARISVNHAAQIASGLTGMGANFRIPLAGITGFLAALMQAGGMFIRTGSGALMLTHVACGRLCAYYEGHINAWDCMAALCILREAGGWYCDFPGPEGLLSGGKILAAPPHLRGALEDLVAQSR
jgi:myo-inositol-1(or 4)-monophosphatase